MYHQISGQHKGTVGEICVRSDVGELAFTDEEKMQVD